MEIINLCAAGIDIGSRSHFVAIGQGEKDVREFGVYSEDLKSISNWFKESQIKTVAMESSGTYRQSWTCGFIVRWISSNSVQREIH